ncbi:MULTISPECIES: porin [unclassified Paraburkholderia]|uniref:porin n=1 Tax=unclassified Paraburkholderia TaxID=2615204 RepID=UPI002AB29166|nr:MULTISPECIES: porin [unclassified Paraburkholderia]
MKKISLGAMSLALAGISGVAHAQNSVTLYGLIDEAVMYANHASGSSNLTGLSSGNLSGSRFGLKGSEDLGGGLSTVFQLESGFDVNTGKSGQGSRLFGRQAFVGLSDNKWGTVTLGRQYDPEVDLVQPITGDNYFASFFGTPGDVDNNDDSARFNNSVKYTSPNINGLQFEGMYAFSGVAGQTGQGYTYGGAVSYSTGGLSLAGGYLLATNGSNDGAVRSSWSSGTADSFFDSAINEGYETAKSVGIAQLSGQYVLGSFTVGLDYSNAQYKSDGWSAFTGTEKYNTGRAFALYQFTPALIAGVGYAYTAASGNTSAHYNQFSIGADYSLSKRTDIYAVGAYQKANGTQLVDGVRQSAQASIGSFGYNGTDTQTAVMLGIRHKF